MSNALVFLDTAALLALANKRDILHRQAKTERNRLAREGRSILTTEWVLTEFLNAMQRPPARTLAIQMIEQLRQSKRVQILSASTEDWHAGMRFTKAVLIKRGRWSIAFPCTFANSNRFEKYSPQIEILSRPATRSY